MPMRSQCSRMLVTGLLAVVVLAVGAAGAGAFGRYGKSSAGTVPACPSYQLSQPFAPWLDLGHYFLAPGGSFESSLAGWSPSGGAALVAGNEPWHVNAAGDSHSLFLPPGSSVTTPAVCVSLNSPDLRLFTMNSGSLLSTLRVDLNYTNVFGKPATTTVGLLVAGKQWSPTLPILFLQNVLPQVGLDGQAWVSFTLRPLGSNGKWQVDDLYVDPLKNQ